MQAITPHSAQRHTAKSARHAQSPAGHENQPALHPERGEVVAHLHHMHNRLTTPGMAAHPLTMSEAHMLRTGAEAITRAANSVTP